MKASFFLNGHVAQFEVEPTFFPILHVVSGLFSDI